MSPSKQSNNPFDRQTNGSTLAMSPERGASGDTTAALLIRMLPRQTTREYLRTLLLFAKDLLDVELVSPALVQDHAYAEALARFRTFAGAEEARSRLNGKQNTPNEPALMVDIIRFSPGNLSGFRQNNNGVGSNRANSSSSTASSGEQARHASMRYSNPYKPKDRITPPNGMMGFSNGGPLSPTEAPDTVSPVPFSFPQSPVGHASGDRPKLSGKAMIGEDGIDDEPAELLKDPMGFAKNDASGQLSRHPTNPQLPMSRFPNNLTLRTNSHVPPPMSNIASPRSTAPLQSPTSAVAPFNFGNLSLNASYQPANQYHHQTSNFPPCNPADQNPPCNTLYVGNLPMETSEDELKQMFSKQRGYKRLCFRTKQNGPMCFVEFDDVSFATKTLSEMYGVLLHNSTKGGIRLSFSKNPLGVRSGQQGGMGPSTSLSASGSIPGMNGHGVVPFSTAAGPPPGLAAPPGLHAAGVGMNGMTSPTGMGGAFGMDVGLGLSGMRTAPAGPIPNAWGAQGGQYSGFGFGR